MESLRVITAESEYDEAILKAAETWADVQRVRLPDEFYIKTTRVLSGVGETRSDEGAGRDE